MNGQNTDTTRKVKHVRDEIVRSETYTRFEILKEDEPDEVWEEVMVKGKRQPAWVAERYFQGPLGLKFRNLVYGKKIWALDYEYFLEEAKESLVITEKVKGYEPIYDYEEIRKLIVKKE